jgi:hypothetical protein
MQARTSSPITVTRAWDAKGDVMNFGVLTRKEGGCFLVDDATLVPDGP